MDRDPLADSSCLVDPSGPRLVIQAGRIVVGEDRRTSPLVAIA
jgi:hypothetical protein